MFLVVLNLKGPTDINQNQFDSHIDCYCKAVFQLYSYDVCAFYRSSETFRHYLYPASLQSAGTELCRPADSPVLHGSCVTDNTERAPRLTNTPAVTVTQYIDISPSGRHLSTSTTHLTCPPTASTAARRPQAQRNMAAGWRRGPGLYGLTLQTPSSTHVDRVKSRYRLPSARVALCSDALD